MTEAIAFRADEPVFVRTPTATRRHLLGCPHVFGAKTHVCTETELEQFPICEWSQDQLDGTGRTHYARLDDAMRELPLPVGLHETVREHLRFVTHDDVWLVYSKSYVALGLGGRSVAGFGKSYVWVGGQRIELPNYVENHGGGSHREPQFGELCDKHFVERSLSGHCEQCD